MSVAALPVIIISIIHIIIALAGSKTNLPSLLSHTVISNKQLDILEKVSNRGKTDATFVILKIWKLKPSLTEELLLTITKTFS